ncbi:MAG: DUF89 family protein [Planctomycetes bacterium]|nr:DUF89 family protein [Planctomycetota bacterium]
MKTYFDCIPCFLEQALKVSRFVCDDQKVHEQVLRDVLQACLRLEYHHPPPVMGRYIHQAIRRLTGIEDPYRDIKDRFNQMALNDYGRLKKIVQDAADPWATAVRLAIAGNIIDFAVKTELTEEKIRQTIDECLQGPLPAKQFQDFRRAVDQADRILYLGDNAGEIVFDRLLLELMPREKITFAVRGAPVINDATMIDAQTAGLTDLVEVIDNGSDVAGTVLKMCSAQFNQYFDQADLIISKGQGNYETLSSENKLIFYLLKVKCPVIARDIGFVTGSMVLQANRALPGV